MVIDSSALVAILRDEPEGEAMFNAMIASAIRVVSAVTILEASMVFESRIGPNEGNRLDRLLQTAQIETIAFDEDQSKLARRAWQKYGKGRHPARLNFGDCCGFAL